MKEQIKRKINNYIFKIKFLKVTLKIFNIFFYSCNIK